MTFRPVLAALLLASLALALPASSAAGCVERDVNGPNGLRVLHAEVPQPPGPVCGLGVVVYLCAAHVDADPNAASASATFDSCRGYVVLPLA